MNIISHRGYWRHANEKNGSIAFRRSFDLGFGTELDVRDIKGELVIAHDMPNGSEIKLSDLLDILDGRDLPLAINIKADGMSDALAAQMRGRNLKKWFTFDMSTPELVSQLRKGMPAYTRVSEYEKSPTQYIQATGVWLDAFERDWFGVQDIARFLDDDKEVCIVSPELHNRDPKALWAALKQSELSDHPRLMLCTDRPESAKSWFED